MLQRPALPGRITVGGVYTLEDANSIYTGKATSMVDRLWDKSTQAAIDNEWGHAQAPMIRALDTEISGRYATMQINSWADFTEDAVRRVQLSQEYRQMEINGMPISGQVVYNNQGQLVLNERPSFSDSKATLAEQKWSAQMTDPVILKNAGEMLEREPLSTFDVNILRANTLGGTALNSFGAVGMIMAANAYASDDGTRFVNGTYQFQDEGGTYYIEKPGLISRFFGADPKKVYVSGLRFDQFKQGSVNPKFNMDWATYQQNMKEIEETEQRMKDDYNNRPWMFKNVDGISTYSSLG